MAQSGGAPLGGALRLRKRVGTMPPEQWTSRVDVPPVRRPMGLHGARCRVDRCGRCTAAPACPAGRLAQAASSALRPTVRRVADEDEWARRRGGCPVHPGTSTCPCAPSTGAGIMTGRARCPGEQGRRPGGVPLGGGERHVVDERLDLGNGAVLHDFLCDGGGNATRRLPVGGAIEDLLHRCPDGVRR